MHRNSHTGFFHGGIHSKSDLLLQKVRIISTFFGKTNACSFLYSQFVISSGIYLSMLQRCKEGGREEVGQRARGQAWKPIMGGPGDTQAPRPRAHGGHAHRSRTSHRERVPGASFRQSRWIPLWSRIRGLLPVPGARIIHVWASRPQASSPGTLSASPSAGRA